MVHKGIEQMAEVLPLLLRKRIRQKIKEAGATVENPKTPEELKIDKTVLKWLVFVKDVKETSDGRYYVECKDKKHC